MKTSKLKLSLKVSAFLMMVIIITGFFSGCRNLEPEVVKNPYEDIDWDNINQYMANLHSHTIKSDGRGEPEQVIQMYADAGYKILAITDHDNYYTNRDGERDVEPTHETTWPWTRWIDSEPSMVWENNGKETSAFYPDLGNQGMLAIRANELTTHPHQVSLFNNCGFPDREHTEENRITCIEKEDGLAYWAHPTDYIPGGRWEDQLFDTDLDEAVSYFAHYLLGHDVMLGIEMQLENRLERDILLLDTLLARYYKNHDIFIMGADDSHGTSVGLSATMTIVFAEELTEDAVRNALQNGHKIVGSRVETLPVFHSIEVNERDNEITLDLSHYDTVTWFKNGREFQKGNTVDYSNVRDAVLRFEVESGGQTFYSQGFYIQ